MRGARIISCLLVLALCVSMAGAAEVFAADDEVKEAQEKIDDAQEEGKKLEEQKKEAQEEKETLSKKLDDLLTQITQTEEKIEAKETEITEKQEELFLAQIDENDQYENMKKRIRYMYENGSAQFVEILCEAKDLSDFLNKSEYISTLEDYDRDMLVEYQKIVTSVEEQKQVLEDEQAEMETLQDSLITSQSEVETLLASTDEEISSLTEEIESNEEKVKELQEAKEAAEEAARKKAEAEAAKAAAEAGSSGAGESVVSGNGYFTHPCPSYTRISSTFGYRTAPKAGASTNHKGVDFAAPTGTAIYAADAGTVTSAGYSGNAGNLLIINHGNGFATYYMHCSKIYVSVGQKVERGQNVAAVGSTGNSTGPHLHFQVMLNGTPVNPLLYL